MEAQPSAANDSTVFDHPSVPATQTHTQQAVFQRFTVLDRKILDLLAQGCPDKQIAHLLSLTPSNLDYHLRQLRKRFEVRSRSQLAAIWSQAQRRKAR